MKIQCRCGTKYAFDVTPEMVRSPIQFVCQGCGQDNSATINQLIREQFRAESATATPRPAIAPPVAIAPPPPGGRGQPAPPAPRALSLTPPAPPPPPAAHPGTGGVPPSPPRPAAQVLRVGSPAAAAAAAAPAVPPPQVCSKHAPQLTTHRCVVCQKPICPKCMQIFGFVCSAYCKAKAENQNIRVPIYEGQRDVAQMKQWRRVGLMVGGGLLLVLSGIGFWTWYAWVGSVPKVAFSARLPSPGYSGQLGLVAQDQVVFLHAGTLARHDASTKKEIWSNLLIDKKRIADDAKAAYEKYKLEYQEARANGTDVTSYPPPDLDGTVTEMEATKAAQLHLHQRGENIWVSFQDKLVRYDWKTGQPGQEIPLRGASGRRLMVGDDLLLFGPSQSGAPAATRINLVSGEAKTQELGQPSPGAALAAGISTSSGLAPKGTSAPGSVSAGRGTTNQLAANRPRNARAPGAAAPAGTSDQDGGKPIDPKAVAASYQNLSTPGRMALPAVLAANANQQRLQAEMADPAPGKGSASLPPAAAFDPDAQNLIPTRDGYVQLKSRLLQSKTVTRKVMKDAPQKSALNGDVNASAAPAVANEILNEMQRDRMGDTVQENVSTYQLTLHRPGASGVADWTGEVSGTAELFPLETVDVVAAGKALLVFDRNNKKLWEAPLSYLVHPIPAERFGFSSMDSPNGAGPCAERGDTLYVFDEAVLTCFDLATGNARWRLPTVGTTGLFFDDNGTLYVNTTTATPDSVKYSRQIDVSDRVRPLVLKVDPKGGRTLWRAVDEGLLSYVSGKFLYTTEANAGQGGGDNDPLADLKSIFEIPAHIRVRRLNAGDGRVLWQHYEKRAPLDVRFERNSFQVLFKREVEVLRFLSF